MRIKKFNESSDLVYISSDRVKEIIDQISKISKDIDLKRKDIEELHNELLNYISSGDKNNQIDDSVVNIGIVKSKLEDCLTSLDDVSNNLKDYDENGKKYLY
jgi:uncharacterized coiled-coil DUF342 family protein